MKTGLRSLNFDKEHFYGLCFKVCYHFDEFFEGGVETLRTTFLEKRVWPDNGFLRTFFCHLYNILFESCILLLLENSKTILWCYFYIYLFMENTKIHQKCYH
jgi:hypothetical protein